MPPWISRSSARDSSQDTLLQAALLKERFNVPLTGPLPSEEEVDLTESAPAEVALN